MRSKLLTEIDIAQDADGMFPCVIVSGPHNRQVGSDSCDRKPSTHPDDITMVLIAAHEQFMMANETELIHAIYPKLLRSFGFYKRMYDTTSWHVPYTVHETYDAVKESATITGEGNLGSSLYNAVNYLLGLHIMREFAEFEKDATTVAEADAMIARVQESIQVNFWQPDVGFYIGDTAHNNTYILENNGWSYHSSDDLHGQVLAYRLGFGDLLPRRQMQLHQHYILRDLGTEWGLQFDLFSHQNWLMSDHSHASLLLRWNEQGAWDTSLRQIRYWREQKAEMTKNTAVIDTNTGQYGLLNYYGYALFFYHTLLQWSGQTVHLPKRHLEFKPHHSAFNSVGVAVLPIMLGGQLGSLTITASSATVFMSFLDQPLSFGNVTICQHVFAGERVVRRKVPLVLKLPAPCDTAAPASVSTVVSDTYCAISSVSGAWSQPPALSLPNMTLGQCQQHALRHHFCGIEYATDTATCALVAGSACYTTGATTAANRVLGRLGCNITSLLPPPNRVDTSNPTLLKSTAFTSDFAPLNSSVYTMVLPTVAACRAQAAKQQACGFLFGESFADAPTGSCTPGAPCCVLNPYMGCAHGPQGAFTGWGASVLGVFAPGHQ